MGALYLLLNFAVNLMLLLKVKFIDFLKKGNADFSNNTVQKGERRKQTWMLSQGHMDR